jgi:hypothetical protein
MRSPGWKMPIPRPINSPASPHLPTPASHQAARRCPAFKGGSDDRGVASGRVPLLNRRDSITASYAHTAKPMIGPRNRSAMNIVCIIPGTVRPERKRRQSVRMAVERRGKAPRCPMNCPIGQRWRWENQQKILKDLVSRLGLEPRALALKGRCSTD